MANTFGGSISICEGLVVPISSAWDALSSILRKYKDNPGSAVLTIDLSELQVPFEAKVSVPVIVEIGLSVGGSKYEVPLTIDALTKHDFFPHFNGVIGLVAQPPYTCQLRLDGNYEVPFKIFGKIIDKTLLHGVAEKSLRTFVDQVAKEMTQRVEHDEIEYGRRTRGMNM